MTMLNVIAKQCPGYLKFVLPAEINRNADNFSEANTNYRLNASRSACFCAAQFKGRSASPAGFQRGPAMAQGQRLTMFRILAFFIELKNHQVPFAFLRV
jgi:hypothetical protein